MQIESITHLADIYVRQVYPKGCPISQEVETKQAYLAGFFECLQISRELSDKDLDQAEKEVRKWFEERFAEFRKIGLL